MNFISISTAVVLFAILLAWYALLEYEDRRLRKDSKRPKHPSETGGRKANGERGYDAEDCLTHQSRRSDKSRPLARMSSPMQSDKGLVFRGMMFGYGLAAVSVLIAYLCVTLGNLLFSFPPLIFFGAAVAFTFTFGGRAPGLLALVLATLLSDFFFVKPTFVFSMDWQVFRLSVSYLLGGLLSVFISKRLTSPTRAH